MSNREKKSREQGGQRALCSICAEVGRAAARLAVTSKGVQEKLAGGIAGVRVQSNQCQQQQNNGRARVQSTLPQLSTGERVGARNCNKRGLPGGLCHRPDTSGEGYSGTHAKGKQGGRHAQRKRGSSRYSA